MKQNAYTLEFLLKLWRKLAMSNVTVNYTDGVLCTQLFERGLGYTQRMPQN